MSVFKSKQIGDVIQFIISGNIAVIVSKEEALYLNGDDTAPRLEPTEFFNPGMYNTLFNLFELVKDAATSDE